MSESIVRTVVVPPAVTPVGLMYSLGKALEYALPPKGISRQQWGSGGKRYVKYTWRCPEEGCWTVAHNSTGDFAHFEEVHKDGLCPEPPRRESLPSGHPEIEKLWREIDDAVDAIYEGRSYRGMDGDKLKGYLTGLSFSVVMKDKEYWPTIKDVSAQALKRRKMRLEEIAYESTPTRTSNDYRAWPGLGAPHDPAIGQNGTDTTAPKRAVKKATPAKTVAPKIEKVAEVYISAEDRRNIRDLIFVESAQFADVAQVYGITVERVMAIAHKPKPEPAGDDPPAFTALFGMP